MFVLFLMIFFVSALVSSRKFYNFLFSSLAIFNSLPYQRQEVITVVVSSTQVVAQDARGNVLTAQIEPYVIRGAIAKDRYLVSSSLSIFFSGFFTRVWQWKIHVVLFSWPSERFSILFKRPSTLYPLRLMFSIREMWMWRPLLQWWRILPRPIINMDWPQIFCQSKEWAFFYEMSTA